MTQRITLKQQKQNRKKWIEALRSGKYKQGKGYLKRNDEYCCLGVACEILGATQEKRPSEPGVTWFSLNGTSMFILPNGIRNLLGLSTGIGDFNITDFDLVSNSLALMNDAGSSFDEISNMIESEPKGLFIK